jgi:hypothetical protein
MISMFLPSKAVRIGVLSGKFLTKLSYRAHVASGTRMRVSPLGGAIVCGGGSEMVVLMVVRISDEKRKATAGSYDP